MDTRMDFNSATPLYKQLIDELQKRISDHLYGPGERIPTEAELAEEYHVSRITVRRAIEKLAEQGVVEKMQGKGTFVCAPRLSRHLDNGPMGFSEMCRANGLEPGAVVLEKKIMVPKSKNIREMLKLPEGGEALFISRLRTGNGKPMAFEESYYPLEFSDLLSIDLEKESIYRYLREVRGIDLHSSTIRLNIAKADSRMSRILEVPKNTPLLEIRGCVIRGDGRPVHTSYQCGYGDHFEFIV